MLILGIIIGLILGIGAHYFLNKNNNEVERLKNENNNIYSENEQFRKKIKDLERENEDLESKINKVTRENKNIDNDIDDIQDELDEAKLTIKKLNADHQRTLSELNEYKEACIAYENEIKELKK